MVDFTVSLYTGSRQGQSPGHQTIPLELRLNRNMPMTADQLSRLISTTLPQVLPQGCELEAKYIHPARWGADAQRWNLLRRQENIEMPSTLQLAALVLADVEFRAVEINENRSITLKEVVRSPMLWYAVTSQSTSSHTRQYPKFRWEPWDDLSDVVPFLDGYDRTLDCDPRERGTLFAHTDSEPQANVMYVEAACKVVAAVVNQLDLGIDFNVMFRTSQSAVQREGFPDFTCVSLAYEAGVKKHHLTGEGEVMTVSQNQTDVGGLLDHARQAADYIQQRDHTYGWLTIQHGTFFIRRKADDVYEITELIPWHQTGCGVIALLTYITIRQLLAQPWKRSSSNATPQAQVDVLTREQRAVALPSSSPGVWTRAAAKRMTSSGAGASSSSSKDTSSRFMNHPLHPPEALQLFQRVLGHGMVGQVTTGRYYGCACAAKLIDACKQRTLLPMMQHEVAIYDRLKHLQGRGIPILYGYGFIDHGNSFFSAMSEIKHSNSPGSDLPGSAQDAAQQVLVKIHTAGLLHGDIRPANILLSQEESGWQAWLIDFGKAREVTSQEECCQEVAELQALFRQWHSMPELSAWLHS